MRSAAFSALRPEFTGKHCHLAVANATSEEPERKTRRFPFTKHKAVPIHIDALRALWLRACLGNSDWSLFFQSVEKIKQYYVPFTNPVGISLVN